MSAVPGSQTHFIAARIELAGTPERAGNNIICRFETLPVRLVPKR
ncbi:hypothetical protein [Nocardia araoensis]|nr:hypothetical protein [Nocardia araoensis]